MAPTPSCYDWQDYGFGVMFEAGKCSFFGGEPVISQAVGWIVVVAFGALFTLLTSVMVFLDYRFGGSPHTSEQFSTAGKIWWQQHNSNNPSCHSSHCCQRKAAQKHPLTFCQCLSNVPYSHRAQTNAGRACDNPFCASGPLLLHHSFSLLLMSFLPCLLINRTQHQGWPDSL